MKKLIIFGLFLNAFLLAGRFWQELPIARGGEEPVATENGDTNGDGKRDLSDAVRLLQWIFRPGDPPVAIVAAASGLPDTGQTTCHEDPADDDDDEDGSCLGQDGSYATGCPSEGRFVDNDNGTVTDNCTGLMWQQEAADDDPRDWRQALDYCENLEFAGHDDWRLPNVRELQSIVDYGRSDPAIDPVFGAFSSDYFSSTSGHSATHFAWAVGFDGGHVHFRGKRSDDVSFVRAVRSGP